MNCLSLHLVRSLNGIAVISDSQPLSDGAVKIICSVMQKKIILFLYVSSRSHVALLGDNIPTVHTLDQLLMEQRMQIRLCTPINEGRGGQCQSQAILLSVT